MYPCYILYIIKEKDSYFLISFSALSFASKHVWVCYSETQWDKR